jgi:iron-sulfur cluster assembly protein
MFQVTFAAAQQIRAAAARSDAAGMALRVAARQTDDGSIEYGTHDGDEPLEFDGVQVLVSAPCQPLLDATVLDWVEIEPGAFSFIFIPPPELSAEPPPAASCGSGGCGSCGARGKT